MTSNVTPFPTGKRVTSENTWIWWGLYYRLESIARRIHFLLEVAEQQESPKPGKTYKLIRKRTVKRCLLSIAEKWKSTETRINTLRSDGWYEIAINIFLELLKDKRWASKEMIDDLRSSILLSKSDKKDFAIIVDLLTWFNLTPSQILQAISWYIEKKIQWYHDDTYIFLKKLIKSSIQ